MDFKKLFENNKAVSPVIGVILMVAITVILAAAIGSSVFGQGTTESAPQANIDIKAVGIDTAKDNIASVRIEHLGGDVIHFEDIQKTKVTASLNGGTSVVIATANDATNGLNVFEVGSVKTLGLSDKTDNSTNAFTADPQAGDTINIKVIDVQTNQLICDKDIRF